MILLRWIGLGTEPDRLAARRVIRAFLSTLRRLDPEIRGTAGEGGR